MPSAATGNIETYPDYRDAVDRRLDAGHTFGEIEEFINACALDEEQKAALWLWGWLKRAPAELPACAGPEVVERTRLVGLWDGSPAAREPHPMPDPIVGVNGRQADGLRS